MERYQARRPGAGTNVGIGYPNATTDEIGRSMRTPAKPLKGAEKILFALAEFGYLTAEQITRLLYAPSSLSHVRKQLKRLVAGGFVLALAGKAVNLPLVYTLSGVGRAYAAAMGTSPRSRFRPSEEYDKGHNPFFLKHTMAVTDVLIAARLLAQTVPGITLSRLVTERELKRKIYVEVPEKICIEPDASVQFTMTETWHETPQTWEDLFHIEVYRNLPPVEWRFKQKIAGYVTYVDTGQREALFQTPALSIAIFVQTPQMATTLKRWTEEALQEIERPQEGDWFFFSNLNVATASPTEMFLSSVWQHAFSPTPSPLLPLEPENR
jgi:hypothetical protein